MKKFYLRAIYVDNDDGLFCLPSQALALRDMGVWKEGCGVIHMMRSIKEPGKNAMVINYFASDLIEMLPPYIQAKKSYSKSGKYYCSIVQGAKGMPEVLNDDLPEFFGTTLAHVCADMLIYLLENGHITAEEVNGASEISNSKNKNNG